ncbi:MAG: helix-turn-helix transcriptional regulator [bacterium]
MTVKEIVLAEEIGNEIYNARIERGIRTQAILAKRIGITRSYLNRIERGKYLPPVKMILKIAKVLNCEAKIKFVLQ